MDLITRPEIIENYQAVLGRVARAAQRAGRDPKSVGLVVVTKMHPVETIQAVLDCGITCLGENYAEEALPKIEAAAGRAAWHMIGHVQSRKAEIVARHFDYLHSLDSLKLAARLDRFASLAGRRLPVLLECNTSGEVNKFGYAAWDESAWETLSDEFARIAALPGLELRGLMTVAPYAENAEEARPFFRKLMDLKNYLAARLPGVQLEQLSMGMSGDFEVAIEEGATWVRIGTSILGPRHKTD